MSDPIVAGGQILATDFVGTRYLAINNHAFVPMGNAFISLFDNTTYYLQSNDTSTIIGAACPNLPHNTATVTSLKAFFYRDDALSTIQLTLNRLEDLGSAGASELAKCLSASTAGDHTVEDTTITNGQIDNLNYSLQLRTDINPNDNKNDCWIYGCLITFTTTTPKQ